MNLWTRVPSSRRARHQTGLRVRVLKLCETGALALDTPLTTYTKRRVSSDPRVTQITARHVLNHTTGFPNWRQGPNLPIEFTPGTKHQYSGEGFSYLQSVVEEVTAQPFETFMLERVLASLGMASSRQPGIPTTSRA